MSAGPGPDKRLANLRPFKKGEGGRPKGSRNKLGEAFLTELLDDFEVNGATAIVRCREDDPAAYIRIVAGLLPKQLQVDRDPIADLTDEQLDRRIRELDRMLYPERYGEGGEGGGLH